MQKKIDYYPGAHGHFLELMLVLSTEPEMIDLAQPIFNEKGACHVKNQPRFHPCYSPKFRCNHYSWSTEHSIDRLQPDDLVVEIQVADEHKMTVIINENLRADIKPLDVDDPEIGTLEKYNGRQSRDSLISALVQQYGVRQNYPRSFFRTYYFTCYNANLNGFQHRGRKQIFPHRSFFSYQQLCFHLEMICDFFHFQYKKHAHAERIWNDFIMLNQGLSRTRRCEQILLDLERGQTVDLSCLGVAEEAWICHWLYKHLDDPWDLVKSYPDSVLARG